MMQIAKRFSLVLAIIAVAWGATKRLHSAVADVPAEAQALLTKDLRFSEANIAALSRGQILKKTLDTPHPDELVVAGAVRLNVPLDYLIAQNRDIASFKKSPYVAQIGTFSTPPRLEDLDRLTVPPEDVDALKRCEPGDCGVKLTTEMLDRLRKGVDWSAPGARGRAGTVLKGLLVERAAAYLAGGAPALGTYADKAGANPAAVDLAKQLDESTFFTERTPELRRFLDEFPTHELRGAEHFLYWSKEAYGFKPVISLTHVTIFTKAAGETRLTFVATRGLYASHYLDTSLGLTVTIEGPSNPGPAVYLIYVNRSRVDALKGALNGLWRWVALRRVRDGMEATLRDLKKRMEDGYAASQRTSSPGAVSLQPSASISPQGVSFQFDRQVRKPLFIFEALSFFGTSRQSVFHPTVTPPFCVSSHCLSGAK